MSEHQPHTTAPEDRLSFGQKFSYGLGSIVNNLLGGAIGFMSIVLNVGLGINPALVGTLQAIPRFTDALTDPIMGYISDKTRSRFGRRRPYIFIGAICVGIVFALMWQLPSGHSEMFYFWFFLFGSILFYLFYTVFATPWVALGYELTSDYHERTRLMAVMNFMGQFAWISLPWFYAIMENDRLFSDSVQGARTLAIVIGVFVAVVGIMPAIFLRERFANRKDQKENASPLKGLKSNLSAFAKGLVITLKQREFLKLCAGTFFLFNGIMLVGAFSSYITIFYVSGGDTDMGAKYMGIFGSINTASTLGAIVIVTWLSSKLGKRRTFLIATAVTLVGSLLKWFCYDPLAPWKVLLPAPLIAVGMGGLFTLMGSMIADVCDMDELETGERREGMFGSIYWWMVKLGMALAFGISGYLLNATGFQVEMGGAQTSRTFLLMRIFDVIIPATAAALSIWAVASFKISEEKSYEIRQELLARRKNNTATLPAD
ncbi:MAG TPA: MFS transporter [bacterium]|jgi:GPH family glycoside/pentoside/hexuronide:cation symporter|nr:MFS transporter [bacterium]HNT66711.1 MFS transporter [bacterium]HOX86867.1 MFS transporter [bacterium]HPG47022.1 MFS transporter [bacterium]HPM99210.1 MFS transporter [bacterium]